jgi:hypothetical protein
MRINPILLLNAWGLEISCPEDHGFIVSGKI